MYALTYWKKKTKWHNDSKLNEETSNRDFANKTPFKPQQSRRQVITTYQEKDHAVLKVAQVGSR